jgi:hypothetical protein
MRALTRATVLAVNGGGKLSQMVARKCTNRVREKSTHGDGLGAAVTEVLRLLLNIFRARRSDPAVARGVAAGAAT